MARPLRLRTTCPRATRIASVRGIHHTPALAARKDAQGKDDLKPEPNEYSKSGSDDAAAKLEDTAFDPSTTDPEQQTKKAGEESGENPNPLDVSPGNPEVSKPRGNTEGGAEGSPAESEGNAGRQRTSGGGSPAKHGGKTTG
ncbi:hypothetical protein K490DRAFT_31379 [Saccharata proteae CBS 121410]|uniref:Uncharacterized protein n=1 Tax=Saccharata proteae CBS 121410 TaxID=1314787 RepID=A0A9P4M2D8_9PEZI|nr:hypothetical protein K490DRAFT_31379 [Saccharata proteae CBS 121410]